MYIRKILQPLVTFSLSLALTLTLTLTFLGSIYFPATAQAQQVDDGSTLIRVNEVQLNPIMTERFRAFHLFQVLPGQRASELPWRVTTEVHFGPSWMMSVITPLENFAELDGSQPVDTELRNALFATAVKSRHSYIVQPRPDLGIVGRDGILPVSRVAKIQVHPGKIAQFEEFWEGTIIPAMRRSGIREYSVFETVMGGPQGEYRGVIYFDTFAELDGFNILSGLSQSEQAAVQTELGEYAEIVDVSLSFVDGELSFGLPNLQP